MKFRRTKLGTLIELCDERNISNYFGENDVRGISTSKVFIKTKADLEGVKLSSYKVVHLGEFAYVADTSRRGEKIGLAFADQEECIVSSIYTIFKIVDETKLNPLYLFMFFNRPEFDRYSRFNSWGSARETFSWEEMCDIDIELPSIDVQNRYAELYNAMLKNQRSYETGIEDLKLSCDACIENLKRTNKSIEIGKYLILSNEKNSDENINIMGISNSQKFQQCNSRVDGVDVLKYRIVNPMEFGYSPIHINEGAIALNMSNSKYAISPIYSCFRTKDEFLLPDYLMLWFQRKEFIRYCWYNAFGSARDTLNWEQLKELEIPIPSLQIQKCIANLYRTYVLRKEINERLKAQIKNLCPILIKGSIEEGRKE